MTDSTLCREIHVLLCAVRYVIYVYTYIYINALRETELRIFSTHNFPLPKVYCCLPHPSLSSRTRVIARELRIVLVRDTSAICKYNQTYIGAYTCISARTCQRRKVPEPLAYEETTRDISSSLRKPSREGAMALLRNYFKS